ncbi:TonB-dependent siderophore receptor [Hyphomicrobium sp.]|uniref:TonB-dependent siderophore receptor n=1 Tax=Hyphomicrobium sp. TaxID=82 RepID=UPI0025C5CBCF|nr:TonB-dependent siderophore receptor [Hyphomicrobium sp.]MCC7252486.1 TonB-dependent siderophore receptor [Hyphomicrobium sp.]
METARGPVDGYVAKRSATGTKSDTPILETPQSLSVVTADQIRTQSAETIGQALRYVPGIIAETGGGNDGARYDFQTLRGFGYVGTHYLDGLKATFGVGNLSMAQFDPYFLERVEVIRGPASVLYGQNPPGGLINMVGKRPLEESFNEVTIKAGTHDRLQAGFDFSGPLNDQGTVLYRVTGIGKRADNAVDFVEEERLAIAPSLTLKPLSGTALTFYGGYQKDPKGGFYGNLLEDGVTQPFPGGGYFRRSFNPGDPSFDHFEREQNHVGVELDHRVNETWSLRHHSRYIHTDAAVRGFLATGFVAPSSISRTTLDVEADTSAFTTDTQLEARFRTGGMSHTLLLGADYLHSEWNNTQGVGLGAPLLDVWNPVYGQPVPVPDGFPAAFLFEDGVKTQEQLGLYVQDQIRIDRFIVTLGGRYDWATTENDTDGWIGAPPELGGVSTGTSQTLKDEAFSGRAGLTYMFDNGLAPYVSYATSFVPVLGATADGTPFEPIKGEQWEGGLKYEPRGLNALFTAAVFEITQENALTAAAGVCGAAPCQTQAGEIRARGVELEAKAELWRGLNVIGSYTYLDSEVTRSSVADHIGKKTTAVPKHMAALWADYTIQSGTFTGLGFGTGVRYFGETYIDALNQRTVPDFTLVDAMVRYDLGRATPVLDGYHLAVNASNLFDETTISCAAENWCNYGLGRVVTGSLTYRW